MKILQLGKFYPIRGGVEKVMYDLTVGLSNKGIKCDMLCATTEDHPGGTIKLNDFGNIFVIRTQIKIAGTMLAPKMISTLRMIAQNYDIIHIHHPDPMATLALFLSKYKGKVVLHWHSDILKQKNLLKLYKPLQNWLLKRANLIVGTTPIYVKESPFLNEFQNKVDFIPIGIEPIKFDNQEVLRIKTEYFNKKIVFSLGRLVEYKGFEYLIRASQKLDDNHVVLIGGKGPLEDSLLRLIEGLRLTNKVFLLGYIAEEMVYNYFAAADVFCMSSILKTEAFGIVQLESMSCGTPVISTKIPTSGVSWVNKDNESGLTVPIEDDTGIAEAINKITKDEDFHNLLSVGSKKRFEQHFTSDLMIDKSVNLYQQILST